MPRRRNIDLDAARREKGEPDGIDLTTGGHTYELPAEMPMEAIDPFLEDEFDLVGLVQFVLKARKPEKEGDPAPETLDVIEAVLTKYPRLHVDVLDAMHKCLAAIFGPEQYANYRARRPSIEGYTRLVSSLFDVYGVSLGEAFASPASYMSSGATPKQSAAPTTESTSETVSEPELTPA